MERYPSSYPKISVVVVSYNGRRHLRECFESLEQLDYPASNLELIVVDNGSTDNSVAFLRKDFPQVEVIQNDENLGFAEGCNIGARKATGDYVAFLNNDMRAHKDWLRELIKVVLESDEIVCAGSEILNWDGTEIDFAGAGLNFYGHGFQEGYKDKDINKYSQQKPLLFACGGAMLIDKKVFLDVGGFDGDYFAFFEDVDLGWRLWVLGYKVMFAPKSIVFHKHHGTADVIPMGKKRVLYERNALCTVIKNYDDDNLQKIFPAALLLCVRRGTILSGLDKRDYRIEPTSLWEWKSSQSEKPPPLTYSRVKERAEEKGIFHVLVRGTLIFWRTISRKIARWFLASSETDLISQLGASYLVALDDVTQNLPGLLAKRREIQAKRKRPDKEIFALFGDPLASSWADPRFLEAQEKLVKAYQIAEIFSGEK